MIAFDSIVCVDPALLLRAVEVYETDRVDFAEAYLVACAETTDVGRIASFDRPTGSRDRPSKGTEPAPYSCIVGRTNEFGQARSGGRFAFATWAGVADDLLDRDAAGALGASDLDVKGMEGFVVQA